MGNNIFFDKQFILKKYARDFLLIKKFNMNLIIKKGGYPPIF